MTVKPTILQELPADLEREKLPRHVAVIMDGNGRWAQRQGQPRIMGHRRGADVLKEFLRCCQDWGIQALTVYSFSTENWRRPSEEVNFLMTLFERFLRQQLRELVAEDVRIRFVGDLAALPLSLQAELERAMEATRHNQGIRFTMAQNYGGRQDILQAVRTIATQVQHGHLQPEDIDEAVFERYLYTAGVCDPDLLIRTSGEMRISNFLLWQVAYAEIYVTETLWPDFDRAEFHQALRAFQQRDRRFGMVKN